jgi:5-methylcytosine-specific restriction protein B
MGMTPIGRSEEPVRQLSASDLGVGGEPAIKTHTSNRPDDPTGLPDDDPLYLEVVKLLQYFGGVIFTGAPGTSKTYSAAKIGMKLADNDKTRIRFTQFHPSYQYEDFIQGFVPKEDGDGFDLRSKHFLEMCEEADYRRDQTFVLVIDELSRGDPGRVFGEALTYVEKSKRDLPFRLASGDMCHVPPNLVILATMNPLDRGVDEVDAAFERRFAWIAMEPDRDLLRDHLIGNGVPDYLRNRIVGWFDKANGLARTNPQGVVGHTYFFDVTDTTSLQSVWDHQLRFLIEKAYRLDPETREELEAGFDRLFEPETTPAPDTDVGDAERPV